MTAYCVYWFDWLALWVLMFCILWLDDIFVDLVKFVVFDLCFSWLVVALDLCLRMLLLVFIVLILALTYCVIWIVDFF